MLTRQLPAVIAVCFSLLIGSTWSTIAQGQNAELSAGELYAQGMEQFEQGELEAARESLRRVDHMQLPPNQRVRWSNTLLEIDRLAAEAEEVPEVEPEPVAPTPAELLAEAERVAGDDINAASQLYRQAINHEDVTADERAEAEANLAQIRRRVNRDVTVAREQIDLAARALAHGEYDEAIERLEMVEASGVSLGWFDQQRVDRQMAMAARQRLAAQPAEPEPMAEAEPEAEATSEATPAPVGVAEAEAQPDAAGVEDEVLAESSSEPSAPESSAEAPAEAAEREASAERATSEPVQAEASAEDVSAESVAARPETSEADEAPAARDDLFERARRLRAQERLAEARVAEEEGNIELAIRRYQAARELDRDNGEIADRLAALQARQQRALAPDDLIERQRLDQGLRGQQAIAEVRATLNTVRQRLEGGDYAAARDAVNRARVTLDREQRNMPPSQYEDLRGAAESLAIEIDDQQAREESLREQYALEQEARDRQAARIRAERERRQQVDELLRRAMEMRIEMRYDQALEYVDRALAIDPLNIAAQGMKLGIEDSKILVEYRDQVQQRDLRVRQHRLQNMEAMQPYTELVTYPHDWPELTVRRLAEMDEMMGEPESNRRVRAALEESIPVNFEANRLVNVIDFFRTTTGQNFFVNWRALEMAGVDQDMPVSLQLANVPAEQALNLVLRQVSSDFEPVRYSVIDGVVHISTEADLLRTTDTRVYDIRDLLVQVPNFDNAPQFDLSSALESDDFGGGSGGSSSSSSSEGLFGDSDSGSGEDFEYTSRAEMIGEISEMIRNSIGRYEDWDEHGGEVSSLREYNGNLIVRSTADNHREIVALLAQLRETRAIQISVEARFLMVDQNFLENIGVDLDFTIHNLGSNFGPISVSQDHASITDRPITELTPGIFTEGRSLSLGVSYLDDLEVDLLVQATQASQRAISLTAPRVTFFNGQRAYVTVARQFAFVSDLEPIPDAAGFNQTLSVLSSGVVLDVEGTVSADRRYVTMTLQPSLSQLDEIRPIVQNALVEIDVGDDDTMLVPISATLEAPTLQITTIATTVSVPDKGTLLLGGQRLVAETEVEAGVPVLSKIPYLNRLFTNTSMVKDERTLLVLVKPTIIIQHEEEEQLYPGLLDDPASYDRRRGF